MMMMITMKYDDHFSGEGRGVHERFHFRRHCGEETKKVEKIKHRVGLAEGWMSDE
jgi:hypothetical protein